MPSRFDKTYSVDARKDGFVVDMRPSTLLEQSLMGGFERTTMPVGEKVTEAAENQTTGGARIGDAIDAIRIGANGRKK
jgi:hypothetical protein